VDTGSGEEADAMSTANLRFETIGDLYYRRHRRLRPGKSEPIEMRRDSSSEENQQLFNNWIATQAFTDAIDRIIDLESALEEVRDKIDGYQDVKDGDYGVPVANDAMKAVQAIDEVIRR
jgi:3-methyladenine DNA glycosylase/8-oxoguanine DNA glycosylase